MTKDDNRRTEANGKDYEPIDDPNRERKRRMKPNPINWLLADEKKKPVLLAITPPRTGERTMLGVENMLQLHCRAGTLLAGAGRRHGRRDPHGPLP